MPETHDTSQMSRYTVHFTGRVQGVGFRFTATNVARRFDVAGYVQNLPDGRVRLVAEGAPGELDRLVEAVNEAMSRYINQHTVEQSAATGEFGQPGAPDTFGVRY